MPEKVPGADRKGVLYYKSQLIELQTMIHESDTIMAQEGDGLTPLAVRAYLMNVTPYALAKALTTYVTLEHGYYATHCYPEVPLDWMMTNQQVVSLVSILNGNAFLRPSMLDPMMKAPSIEFFGYSKTVKQQKLQWSKRYITRSKETVYQPLYVDSKPKNFFLGLVDDLGAYVDFPEDSDEFPQLRQMLVDSLSYDRTTELFETIVPRQRPTKVIHFQHQINILGARDVPKFLSCTPWLARMITDPFNNVDEVSRNWLFFYRSCNPMRLYTCKYSAPDPAALRAFGEKRGLGPLMIEVEDKHRCVTIISDGELANLLSLEGVENAEKKKKSKALERMVAIVLEHQAADLRFDPPDVTADRNLVFGPDHKIVKVAQSPLKNATIHDLDGDFLTESHYDDDDDLFGEKISDDEMDVEQARIVRNDERNEARKEEVLAVIPAAPWQKAGERINGQERILMRRPNEDLSSFARIRDKFWGWLKHDRPNELLNVNSVSEATLEEAMQQWCVVEAEFINFMDAYQEEVRKDLEEEVENDCRDSIQPTLLCARRLSDEKDDVIEVDPPRVVTVEHDGATPQGQISVAPACCRR